MDTPSKRCREQPFSSRYPRQVLIPFDPPYLGSGIVHAVVGTAANRRKVCDHVRSDFQGPGTQHGERGGPVSGTAASAPWRRDAMPLPAIPQSGVLEEDEEIVGDDADSEESGIGAFLTTGHPFHAKADLEFLDAILGMLTPLAIPDQHIGGTAATIAGDDVVTGLVLFQEFSLMDMAYHDEMEGFMQQTA